MAEAVCSCARHSTLMCLRFHTSKCEEKFIDILENSLLEKIQGEVINLKRKLLFEITIKKQDFGVFREAVQISFKCLVFSQTVARAQAIPLSTLSK